MSTTPSRELEDRRTGAADAVIAVHVPARRSETALRPGPSGVRGRLRAVLRRAARVERRADDEAWESTLVRLFGRSRTSVGNAITVQGHGDEWLDDLCASFDAATTEIWIESYTVRDDRAGRRIRAHLVAAAERGVDVVLVIDGAGSATLGSAFHQPLLQSGVRVGIFSPPWRWWKHGLLRRNHRKVIVIDGACAFVGGMNIGEEYMPSCSGDGCFEDVHLRIDGPAAAMLRARTARLFGPAGLIGTADAMPGEAAHAVDGEGVVQVLETDATSGRREIQAAMRVVLAGARRSIDIVTPYLVPPTSLVQAIIAASHRGVRVRLLTAGRSDVPVVALAARHVYDRFLAAGVNIHELHDRTLHAKIVLVDDEYALVGSFNLDQWSHRRNLELNVGVVDASTTASLQAWIDSRIARAVMIDAATHARRPWWRRLVHAVAWGLMHL